MTDQDPKHASGAESRRVIIGVMGGDKQKKTAQLFGAAVAKSGCILLTGGRGGNTDEVKDACIQGALNHSKQAKFIGILAGRKYSFESSGAQGFFLHTGLKHYERNVINGVTPDVVVVFGGSSGTLAEAAFAIAAKKPVFLNGPPDVGARERLLNNYKKHFKGSNNNLTKYILKPLQTWRNFSGIEWQCEQIRDGLGDFLSRESDWPYDAEKLVMKCISEVKNSEALGSTMFPGIPKEAESKTYFEKRILCISKS